MKKLFVAFVLAGSLAAAPVHAAQLTAPQVSAIINLLIAFGVEKPTIDIVYAQLAPAAASTPETTRAIIPVVPITNPVPNQAVIPMDTVHPSGAQEPFKRTGSITASLTSSTKVIPYLPSSRIILATLSFTNNTNETIMFAGGENENDYLTVSQNTIAGWAPYIRGVYRNDSLANDRTGVKPGQSGSVQFFVDTSPTGAGSFHISFSRFMVVGDTTGEFISVDGFPIDLGVIEAK